MTNSNSTEQAPPESGSSSSSARLKLTLRPIHYDLTYTRIDLENFVFAGTCALHGTALETTNILQLNALELQIVTASWKEAAAAAAAASSDSTAQQVKHDHHNAEEAATATSTSDAASAFSSTQQHDAISYRYHKHNQTVDIAFAENFQAGKDYIVSMDFIGVLNDQMAGLYRSVYRDIYGQSKVMATTQFEATDARRAFPCADEPALKATFTLTVTIPAELQCISNTPMASTHTTTVAVDPKHGQHQGKRKAAFKTITFQKTPKMSTYLLALVVGEFDGISTTSNQIVTTVYTVPGKADQAQFCLDTASRCLDLYQDMFHVPYPLTKSDLLAIPDFAAGAMENWGCVTYREAKILVKQGSTSESTKRGIARTVCHELAHMWFGNLVTMEYWTQLYLKEGMARFMEFVGIAALFPHWDAWTEFVQDVYGLAMSLDAMQSSHPIEVEVHHPDEIGEIFDNISYAKGASVVRMIARYIGMDTFFDGMKLYLTRHAYSNTVTNDLWRALEEVSGKPIVQFMEPWTLQVGYPILELSDNGTIKVERYLATGPEEGTEKTPWSIPVTAIVEGSDEVHGPWVIHGPDGDDTDTIQAEIKEWTAASKWFKLNVDQTGFFRVAYTKEQSVRLSEVMKPNADNGLSTTDRLGLISDSFAAGKAGYCSIQDCLALIEHFGEHETAEYAVWQELSENLSALASVFRSEPFFPKFQTYLRQLYARQMRILGWDEKDGEEPRTGTLRSTVIGMLGVARDPDVLQTAGSRLLAYSKGKGDIPGDLRLSIFACAMKHDEAVAFEVLKEIYETTSFPEEQRNCLTAMGCVTDRSQHVDMLDYVFNSGKVRLQDISMPLGSLAGTTDEGGRATWSYFCKNYEEIRARIGSGPVWGACVALSCRGLTTLEEAAQVEEFFRSRDPGSAKRRLSQALEVVRTKAARRERDRHAMQEYFLRIQE